MQMYRNHQAISKICINNEIHALFFQIAPNVGCALMALTFLMAFGKMSPSYKLRFVDTSEFHPVSP